MADRKPKIQVVDITNGGKMPPHNTDAERRVLGLITMERRSLDIVTEIIKGPEYFYLQTHQDIYEAMLQLRETGSVIDMMTLSAYLIKTGKLEAIGGAYYLVECEKYVTGGSPLEDYCKIVTEAYMYRKLITVGGNILHHGYEANMDVFDLIDYAEREIMSVNAQTNNSFSPVSSDVFTVMKKLDDLRQSDKELTGVNTGFRDINRITCGWQAPDLIILAARPSVGKTALALNFALAAVNSEEPTPVGIFSMEMSTAQLVQRLLSMQSEMYLEKITRGKLTEGEMADLNKLGAVPLSKLPLYIDDSHGLTIYELRTKARKMKSKHKVGMIIIDYLQLMSGASRNGRDDNREQEISKISRDLKSLAKELHIPIIALSQLSRAVESRQGKKMPQLSDLRESGAIEQDADIVMFMYRPEYYGITAGENGENLKGETHLKYAKNRGGALDTVKLKADLAIQKFHNFDEGPVQLGLNQQPAGGSYKPVVLDNGDDWDVKF